MLTLPLSNTGNGGGQPLLDPQVGHFCWILAEGTDGRGSSWRDDVSRRPSHDDEEINPAHGGWAGSDGEAGGR